MTPSDDYVNVYTGAKMLGWIKINPPLVAFKTIGSQHYYQASVIQQKYDSTLLSHDCIITLTVIYYFFVQQMSCFCAAVKLAWPQLRRECDAVST